VPTQALRAASRLLTAFPHLPRGVDGYGNDVIQGHMVYTQADIVWTLIDAFALDLGRWRDLPWALYSVIDCEPIRPQETHHFQDARWVVAMSKFGAKQLENIGRQPLYVPHAIDTTVFRPTDREQGREMLKILAESGQRAHHYRTKPLDINDETFIITTCAANGTGWPSRKGFSLMLEAFAIFLETHPNSLFYIHSEPLGVWKGEPLLDMAAQYSLENNVLFPSSYVMLTGLVSKETLNDVYNAADVFLLMSTGEGFGIPIAEAQAAGCPVIVSNFSACRELCLTGWTVNGPYFQFTPMCKTDIARSSRRSGSTG
jgi:glycosyltransferase involved in cell wall biosynthesis